MKRVIGIIGLVVLASGAYWQLRDQSFNWNLPEDIPPPAVPATNLMTKAKVSLGRHLFYDKRLSANNKVSCATCHRQDLAFTDGLKGSFGLHGDLTPRNSMNLTNVGYNQNFTWANPLSTQLEHQARVPLFGDEPAEMGLTGHENQTLEQLKLDPLYQKLFPRVFGFEGGDPFNFNNIIDAISAFERTMLSFNSPYDQYLRGESTSFGASEKRGMEIFFSEKGECFHCHGGFNFTDSSVHKNSRTSPHRFHNNGLYNVDGRGGYPKSDRGLYDMTSHKDDMGKFKAPTLRNIAVTAPFMHDGSIATLEEVVDHYIRGGTNIESGENKGLGVISPLKSEFVPGLELDAQQRTDLLNFLHSLTDESFLKNPELGDPWRE
jgi:cytochrome c peroxidase